MLRQPRSGAFIDNQGWVCVCGGGGRGCPTQPHLRRSVCTPLRHVVTFLAVSLGAALAARSRVLTQEANEAVALADVERRALAAMEETHRKPAGGGGSRVGKRGEAAADAAAVERAVKDQAAKVGQVGVRATQLTQHTAAVSDVLTRLFEQVVLTRYRDVDATVRADTVAGFSRWLLLDPATFVTNTHLKYIGWLLNDVESAAVRLLCVELLRRLYVGLPHELRGRLSDFMSRFRPRLTEMTHDVSAPVCTAALRLFRLAVAAGHFTAEHAKQCRGALLSDDLPTRRAAAQLQLICMPAFLDGGGDGGEDDGVAGTAAESDEDMVAAPPARGGKGDKKSGQAAQAAKAAAAARRNRAQLSAILSLAASLLPGGEQAALRDGLAAPTATLQLAQEVVDRVTSGFWGLPAASLLTSWDALADLLLKTSTDMMGETW